MPIFSEVVIMKHTFRTLLGLVLLVFVLAGCSNPAGPEIPEGAKVEFVWGTNPQVSSNYKDKLFYYELSRYLLGLESDQNGNNCSYKYPEDYKTKYEDYSGTSEEYFKKLYEDAFEKVFGTKYYKEGTSIDLTKWTSKAKDLLYPEENFCSQLYFMMEDIGKEDYDKDTYKSYLDYLDKKSFSSIEVYNQDIKVYVYWKHP